jgi:AraC-like DNA-binding protein
MRLYVSFQHWKNRKYLRRIFLSVTIGVTLLMLATVISVQHYSEKAITNLQMAEDIKTLNQINYNINLMSDMVKASATHLYNNPDYYDLLHGEKFEDQQLLIRKLVSFNNVVSSSSFLHSAILYNGVQEQFYADSPSLLELANDDIVKHYIESNPPILKLDPIYSDNQIKLFMMAYYDSWVMPSRHNSAVILTIRPEWLFKNIEMINSVGGQESEQLLFVMNKDGELFTASPAEEERSEGFRTIIFNYIQQTGNQEGFFLTEHEGKKYSISFLTAKEVGWKIITVQSYDKLVGNLETLRETTIGIGLSLLIVSVILSIIVTLRIYNPISKVIHQFRNQNEDQGVAQDEIKFMTQRYRDISNENFQLKHNVAKNYHLRRMVMDSSSYNQNEMKEVITEYDLKLGEHSSHILFFIQIDNYEHIMQRPNVYDNSLYKFALSNITEEVIGAFYPCEAFDLRNDHIVAIINRGEHGELDEEQLKEMAQRIQQVTLNYYKLTLTITVSDPFTGYGNMSDHYERCIYLSKYRLAYGGESIITSKLVQVNEESEAMRVSNDLEAKLIEQIRANKREQYEETLQDIFESIQKMKYNNMINSVLQLIHMTSDFIQTMNEMKVSKVQRDTKVLYQEVLDKETLDEIQELFKDIFHELSSTDDDSYQKNKYLIEGIKGFIEESYSDLNLNLEFIANHLKMSPGHISKLFKQTEKLSITDYINELRLLRTLTLLEETELSTKEIMALVGFGSESYFYRLFKKRFGVTPKQYQLKSSMDE